MRKVIVLSCVAFGLSAAFLACSGGDTTPVTGSDSGADTGGGQDAAKDTATPPDSGTDSSSQDSSSDVAVEAGPVNGCVNFVDFTAADAGIATVSGPGALAAAAQYTPNCVKIKVGASVKWNVGFTGHPLVASSTGDTPNPITLTATGTTATFAFPTKGTYGFQCQFHGGLTMFGAVQVVP